MLHCTKPEITATSHLAINNRVTHTRLTGPVFFSHIVLTTLLFVSSGFDQTCLASNSVEIELDPYYSNLGYYISLTDEAIPEVIEDNETVLYLRLLDRAFSTPRFMVLELSVNPLPLLGVHIRKHHANTYENAQLRGDFNLVQALTEGFEEPYALSLFLGGVEQFVQPGQSKISSNKSYNGYLLSIGSKHIVNNQLVDDNWYELEWKIKGDQDFHNRQLSWSLRVGAKIHDNQDITDVVYFGLRRNHFDSETNGSWFDDADIEYTIELNKNNLSLTEQSLFVNKKWATPFSQSIAFEFGIGFVLERNKYLGSLQSQTDEFSVILRPGFHF